MTPSQDITAGLPHDRLYYGAPAIALRLFGSDSEENIRTVYYLGSEAKGTKRLKFLFKLGGRLACYESAIQRHAEESGNAA